MSIITSENISAQNVTSVFALFPFLRDIVLYMKTRMNFHVKNVIHKKILRYKCELCDKAYSQKGILNVHVKIFTQISRMIIVHTALIKLPTNHHFQDI